MIPPGAPRTPVRPASPLAPAPVPAPAPAAALPDTVARVMVCDDSAVIRAAIAAILERDPGIRVVARAANGAQAVAAARLVALDVVVLDIEMPVMDGLAALPLLLAHDPGLRVIMASTLTTRGADIALHALRLGAADTLPKPASGALDRAGFAAELLARVRGLARLRRRKSAYLARRLRKLDPDEVETLARAAELLERMREEERG